MAGIPATSCRMTNAEGIAPLAAGKTLSLHEAGPDIGSGRQGSAGGTMAEKAEVRAEIDAELKERAESILKQLGISPSGAVEMLFSAIVRANGLPPELLQSLKPTAVGGMSGEELDAELRKGYESLQSGKLYTADEVDQMMKEEFWL